MVKILTDDKLMSMYFNLADSKRFHYTLVSTYSNTYGQYVCSHMLTITRVRDNKMFSYISGEDS